MARSLHRRGSRQTPADGQTEKQEVSSNDRNAPTLKVPPTLTHRAKSARRPHNACGLDDGVDAAVELYLSVYTAHCALLGGNDGHLHLTVVDKRVEDGLDVVHGKVHLPVGHTRGT